MTAAILRLNRRTFASLRRHRNYRLFFGGQVVSVTGSWMQNVALAWLVIELSDSAVAVGGLAFARFLPFTVLGLFAGVITDRLDYRRLVIATQAASMAVSALLTVLVLGDWASLPVVYALAALLGTALVFDAPGRHALTFQMVGREELANAVALNSSLFNASRVIGPAVAGVLIAWFGVGACFLVNTVSFLAVLASLLAMRKADLFPVAQAAVRPEILRGTREGIVYAWRSPEVRLVLAIVTVVSTVGFNFHVILPLLASETLKAGPEVFGILSASFGAGALVGALLSAALGRASWKLLVAGTGGFSLAMLALAPLTAVWACAALLFAVGVSFTLWTSNANAILQLRAPDHLRGRVLGLYLFAFAGLAPIGGLLAGWLTDVGGTELAFVVAGAAGVGMAGLAATRLRTLLRPPLAA